MKPIAATLHTALCLMLLTLLISPAMAQDAASTRTVGGVKSMEDRVRHLEEAVGWGIEGRNWFERIQVEGVIEFEAAPTRTRFSDPATLVLGETNDGAVVVGYRFAGDMVEVSAGLFNGAVGETGDDDMVGGWSAYLTVTFLERFTFVAEYAAALDHFKAGEIYDTADTQDRKPAAWNLELGFSALENLDLAIEF